MKSIENYIKVIEYLDNFEAKLLSKYRSEITCSKNCSDCCILKTVFPIEAYYIYTNNQSVEVAVMETNHCEFLKDNSCQIYAYRPVICRTHGYPIFIDNRIDFCRLNFVNSSHIESDYIINVDELNNLLSGININFMKENKDPFFRKERIQLKELYQKMLDRVK